MTIASPVPLAAGGDILEVETGLQQLMGDHALYRQILRRFRQRYQDSAEQARTELLAGETDGAQRIVHTLKGAAGMIGAQQVYLLAAAVEPLFDGPPAQCIGPLAQLEQTLRSLMAAIDTELAAADQPAAQAPVLSTDHPPATRMLVQHLARLLEEGDGAAIDVLERSASVLAAGLGVAVFQEVTEAAHQFDFEAALAVLQAAQK
jgi:HPt (histidine-containing phosphotransfer) domain-containing protein